MVYQNIVIIERYFRTFIELFFFLFYERLLIFFYVLKCGNKKEIVSNLIVSSGYIGY